MELEQQLERIKGRQGDDKETIEMFKVGKNKNWNKREKFWGWHHKKFFFQALYLKFEPASESEENTVGVKVTVDMSPHDVAQAILTEVKKK